MDQSSTPYRTADQCKHKYLDLYTHSGRRVVVVCDAGAGPFAFDADDVVAGEGRLDEFGVLPEPFHAPDFQVLEVLTSKVLDGLAEFAGK